MKVSIILPIYNAEIYLRNILNCLHNQSFNDFEVIMINDGSTDSSEYICKEYTKIDKRFRVIHKENEGVSAARQTGLEAAQGEYIIHADADDWVETQMLKEMLECAEITNADIVLSDFFTETETYSEYRKQEPKVLDSNCILHEILRGNLHGALWNKLVRMSIIKKYNIRFESGINYCEDVLFWVDLLQTSVSVAYLPKAFYHYDYRINTPSLTRNYSPETIDQRMKFVTLLEHRLNNDSFKSDLLSVKLGIKFEIFDKNILSNSEFKKIFPELTKKTFKLNTSFLNRILLYFATVGLYRFAYKIYKMKNLRK